MPAELPYLALHDLSAKGIALSYLVQVKYDVLNIGISPSGLQRIEKMIASRPGFRARVGVVFGPTYSGNLGQIFASRDQKKKSQPALEYKVFFTREQGFSWLAEKGWRSSADLPTSPRRAGPCRVRIWTERRF